jgi:hypothetical protein
MRRAWALDADLAHPAIHDGSTGMTETPAMQESYIAEAGAGVSPSPPAAPSFPMYRRRSTPGLIVLQARILETVAEQPVLAGTISGVASQLSTGASPLREALRGLRAAGWIAVHPQPAEYLTVRMERRRYAGGAPATGERRAPHQDAWAL